ncbi:hypothetical protein [Aquabacterium sp. OR-4]|uniref:hypothetical protein n=1 Tax=Aquabacterium sp. OR-4 TaxID=2978127 RepID=UPI0021B28302|nr:hypothetical protein [Aquabacterium sp. OR-4]MDT7834276.1 hypothetical protein [Aquabacterium sp. OR-4]
MTAAPRPAVESANPATAAHDTPTLGDVVARLAAEVAVPLTQALERVMQLAHSGKIDRLGVQALRDEIDLARTAGLRGQQIARFIDGQAHPSVERVSLTEVLGAVIAERASDAGPQGPGQRQLLADLQVMGDATLIHRLLRAAADWAGGATRSALDWRLDLKSWPVRARVTCQFDHRPVDHAEMAATAQELEALDTLDWLLLQYAAHVAGVLVLRELGAVHCTLTLEFPHTVGDTVEHSEAQPAARTSHATLTAGGQVLVLAARREARQLVREALRGHDLFIDYVATVLAAREYCADGTPQVLIYEAGFAGDGLKTLLGALAAAPRPVALVEIAPDGQDYEMGAQGARVGADGLRHTLPAVLMMELARAR